VVLLPLTLCSSVLLLFSVASEDVTISPTRYVEILPDPTHQEEEPEESLDPL
jgi:hypothetical protein